MIAREETERFTEEEIIARKFAERKRRHRLSSKRDKIITMISSALFLRLGGFPSSEIFGCVVGFWLAMMALEYIQCKVVYI